MKTLTAVITMLMATFIGGCNPTLKEVPQPPIENPGDIPDEENKPDEPVQKPEVSDKMNIMIGTTVFTATLEHNATADAFRAMLPMTVNMGEHNGNEKYYYLPGTLPVSSTNPGRVSNGDIMLYGSNCLVLFYETFSTSYSYTRIGRVDNPGGLQAALGSGNITVKFESDNE